VAGADGLRSPFDLSQIVWIGDDYSRTITKGQSVGFPALFSIVATNVPVGVLLSETFRLDGEILGACMLVATANPPTVPAR
jgi:hypothetical protein